LRKINKAKLIVDNNPQPILWVIV